MKAKQLIVAGAMIFSIGSMPVFAQQVSECKSYIPIPIIAAIIFLITLVMLIKEGTGKDMLRDPLPPGVDGERPFSLGKTQMAWWFIIILGSYLYVWAVTGTLPVLSPGLLAMAGISGSTGAVSVMITDTENTQYPVHTSFLHDLVTDKDGVTLHRFQMIAMTLILGIAFVIEVVTDCRLPADFQGTTLGLMGISSGTYLGFKVPEKRG